MPLRSPLYYGVTPGKVAGFHQVLSEKPFRVAGGHLSDSSGHGYSGLNLNLSISCKRSACAGSNFGLFDGDAGAVNDATGAADGGAEVRIRTQGLILTVRVVSHGTRRPWEAGLG